MTASVNIPLTISAQRLSDIIVTCFEGGSNHWLGEAKHISDAPPGDGPWYARPEFFERANWEIELSEILQDDADGVYDYHRLDRIAVATGLMKMVAGMNKYTNLRDLVMQLLDPDGVEDAWEADSILQFCVFGELVYG